jgi:hypothetical protein
VPALTVNEAGPNFMLAMPMLFPAEAGAGLLLLVLLPYPLLALFPLLHAINSRLPQISNITVFSECLVFMFLLIDTDAVACWLPARQYEPCKFRRDQLEYFME